MSAGAVVGITVGTVVAVGAVGATVGIVVDAMVGVGTAAPPDAWDVPLDCDPVPALATVAVDCGSGWSVASRITAPSSDTASPDDASAAIISEVRTVCDGVLADRRCHDLTLLDVEERGIRQRGDLPLDLLHDPDRCAS